MRTVSVTSLGFAAAVLLASVPSSLAPADTGAAEESPLASKLAEVAVEAGSASDFNSFLDRLMIAESGGRDNAANPRSSAVGPFQFIRVTFLEIARRHFTREIDGLSDEQILALRTNRSFARRAALLYAKTNAAFLASQGVKPTFADLRLAHLVGPRAASRLLLSEPQTPLSQVVSPSVLRANPFMVGKTATDLIARTAREVSATPALVASTPRPRSNESADGGSQITVKRPQAPPDARSVTLADAQAASVKVVCNMKLVVCRRWVTLQLRKQARGKVAEGHPRSNQRNSAPRVSSVNGSIHSPR